MNMHTVNKAYAVLKQEGFIQLDRRKGAVIAVSEDKLQALEDMKQQLRMVLARGYYGKISHGRNGWWMRFSRIRDRVIQIRRTDMENRYTKQAREALDAAESFMQKLKHPLYWYGASAYGTEDFHFRGGSSGV